MKNKIIVNVLIGYLVVISFIGLIAVDHYIVVVLLGDSGLSKLAVKLIDIGSFFVLVFLYVASFAVIILKNEE